MIEEYDFPPELLGGVWHSTSFSRYLRILDSGNVSPEPDLPDSERWSTSRGKRYYSFVRSMGGVSLFDFRDFNVNDYSNKYNSSNWATFVPGLRKWKSTIWLEIDIRESSSNFICPNEVMEKWHNSTESRQVIPRIEAAYIGEIPITMIKRVLKYCSVSGLFTECK